jgi:hypothetical protein
MKGTLFLLLFLLLFPFLIYGQSIEWQKNLGGSDFDVAMSIRQTNDSGYIVAGYC